ncbi:MAG: hypothetical protein MUC79_01720 [Thiobacillaceae bacterium]|jgi:K+-sensing histidine kinase KdpD|nr:hypothetical protein [Thiobacillaceae bacterium]
MTRQDTGIRRILVALSGAGEELGWIEAAADLAVSLEAELAALFVEDVDLLRASRLPSMREMGRQSAQLRDMQSARLEQSLRAVARRFEEAMQRAAQVRTLRCSFQVVQGKPLAAVLSRAGNLDVVLVGRRAAPPAASPRPVAVLFDGSMAAAATLAVALRLAHAEGRACVVLIAAADADSYREHLEQARWAIGGRGDASVQRLADSEPGALSAAANRLRVAALLLPAAYAEGSAARIDALRAALRCDLLLVA